MSVTSIATSGMASAVRQLEISARNVADAPACPTDEQAATAFAALRADRVEITGGGVAVNVVPAQDKSDDEVNVGDEAIQQTIAAYTLAANAEVMRAATKMQKSVLDILA